MTQILFSFNVADMLLEIADKGLQEAEIAHAKVSQKAVRRKRMLKKELESRRNFRRSIDTLEDRVKFIKQILSNLEVKRIL